MARNLDFQGYVSAQDPRTFPTIDIRNLEAQGGNQEAILQQSGGQADQFSSIVNLLKQYQLFGRQQQQGAERQQAQSIFSTPSNLIGAAPGIQAGVREDVARSFEPTIGFARNLVQEAKQAIMDYQETQLQQQDQLRKSLLLASEAGSTALEGLFKSNPQAFKAAGLDAPSFIAGIKAKEVEEKRRFAIQHAPKVPSRDGPSRISPIAQSVIDGVIRLEDLTPTVRGQIAPELAAAGFKTGPKLSSGQQDDIATMDVLSQQINQLQKYTSGGLEGVGGFGTGTFKQFLSKNLGISTEEGNQVRAIIGNLKGTIAKLRGGTSFTTNEEKLLDTYTPGINESTSSITSKLVALNTFLTSKRQALLGAAKERGVQSKSSGVTPSGLKYNLR